MENKNAETTEAATGSDAEHAAAFKELLDSLERELTDAENKRVDCCLRMQCYNFFVKISQENDTPSPFTRWSGNARYR